MPSNPSQRVKPPALRPGDTVGIVAPASSVNRADFLAGCEALRRAGYRPFYFESIFDRDLFFAGALDRRVRELEEMFTRDDVRAIICARGGYGANYLLSQFDLEKVAAHPKIFVGYSDPTCLLTHFLDAAGLITFHGPMVAKDWLDDGGVDLSSWQASVTGTPAWEVAMASDVVGLADGEAEGVLYGGCLSILVASLGTPYQIKTAGTILFLEDLAAKPYQIDRMLMQLKLCGFFADVRGIVFGEMLDCVQTASQGYTLQEVVTRIVGDLGVPVAYGVRSGHVTSGNITLPFGVQAKLAVKSGQVKLQILEAAVSG
ncbi:MAG TPA: LD-carboxypeptidase [Candidatus Solibacter sp.]|nr:LD-carboxypeptidase [Candidatus Solibacter sp.]